MRRPLVGLVLVSMVLVWGTSAFSEILRGYGPASPTELFRQLAGVTLGDWPTRGREFIELVPSFKRYFLAVILGVSGLFLLHFLIFGPKRFSRGEQLVPYYGAVTRLFHWIAALCFTCLFLSGLAVLFAKSLGAGSFVRTLRVLHLVAGFGFFGAIIPLFLIWWRDMLPASYDLSWFLSLGGYLSRKKEPVPAGKFNAGQKLWFWLATVGGVVMFYTGFYLYRFEAPVATLRTYLIIHNVLALILTAFFITHLYMTLFAVKGALKSMITGRKGLEEIKYLHPKFLEEVGP
ncbi:MAG: formate dehydrogenase subunit gamma [Thermodesulfobacteria bacterium]|nr:formate dehydrogenase subunit gamma [Thermodesulfobacteriota bacterium]